MFMRKPSFRNFEYIPRFYKPEDDESERRRWRINVKFRSQRKRRSAKPIYFYLVIFAIVLYLYFALIGVI